MFVFHCRKSIINCGSISRLSSVRLILSSTNFVPTKVQVRSNVSYYSRLVSRKTERLPTFAEYFLFIVTRFNETFFSQNETLVSRNEVFVLRAGGNLHFSVLHYDFSGQVKVPASNVDCPNACLVCVNPSLVSFRFFFPFHKNGGSCQDGVASFTCVCTDEFSGHRCERQQSLCTECTTDTLCVKFIDASIR